MSIKHPNKEEILMFFQKELQVLKEFRRSVAMAVSNVFTSQQDCPPNVVHGNNALNGIEHYTRIDYVALMQTIDEKITDLTVSIWKYEGRI